MADLRIRASFVDDTLPAMGSPCCLPSCRAGGGGGADTLPVMGSPCCLPSCRCVCVCVCVCVHFVLVNECVG
jgi:hypothetical protein